MIIQMFARREDRTLCIHVEGIRRAMDWDVLWREPYGCKQDPRCMLLNGHESMHNDRRGRRWAFDEIADWDDHWDDPVVR